VYRDSALVLQAAESGQGVALGRSWLVADALRAGSLCRIGSLSVPAAGSYFLVTPRDTPPTTEVGQFIAWIRGLEQLDRDDAGE
jgi:LysR family glycine cleavage system transcriptional activator